MDISEIVVLAGGVALIGLVLWYFFAPGVSVAAKSTDRGVQQIEVTVKGGYAPDTIAVKRGKPVRLIFFRDEEASCSEQVLLPDFGIARSLPAHRRTSVEFTPETTGTFPFTCGMNMMRGTINVEPESETGN